MKTDKTKLLKDIEEMKEKLASMEEELNKPEVFKHFPSQGEVYHFYTSSGSICSNDSSNVDLKVNVFKSKEEAQKAYNKAVALEKVKRRLLELQGDWKPNFNNTFNKYLIFYNHANNRFDYSIYNTLKYPILIPYIKTSEITNTIIDEMEDELKLIFDIT